MSKIVNGYMIAPRAYLYGANLSRANLSRADLSGANLSGANLFGANLFGANLCGADLYGANLRDADLYGANLCGANLCGANLCGANLYGANLSGADDVVSFGYPYSWNVVLINTQEGIRIAAGCRWFTWRQANKHWKERGKERAGMLPLLQAMRVAAKERGWNLT